ncbi:unnamed protein product [Peronospora destructor]|uniref:ABC transporter domain-containing protein n=1 Tax=Peronospora destructor TaxID=86335 RepID=A0AAV0TTK0_9STRA|nr:unnamed protein product [Peronospora destructor]
MLAFAFIPAAIVAFVVREKNPNQNAKSLQLICGANVSAYWLSTWTHDIVIMMVTVIASMIMVPFSDRTLKSSMEVWGIVSLIGSHALAVIPMAYLFSFKFKEHAVAQTSLLVFAICTGYSLNNGIYEIATRKLSRSSLYGNKTEAVAPPSFFGLWKGLGTQYTCTSCWDAATSEDCCVRNVFDLDVAGAPIVYAVVEIVIFMLLVFIIENRNVEKWSNCTPPTTTSCSSVICVNDTEEATIWLVTVLKLRRVLGYCPQVDSLHDLLTVEEQLELYAQLKGIPSDRVKRAVDQKIEELDLVEYRTKLTQRLSGGNKRKVSAAIALIGSPRIIFLDEPSTGVDPSSRRKMWDVIASVCATKESCVVLITHSMEECEALCTRVGILVNGNLKCLGSVEHLKQKFGRRYIVEVKMQEPSSSSVERLQLEVHRILEGNSLGISQDHINILCSSLGVSNRAQEIMDGEGNGNVIKSYLETSGIIPIDVFCAWWHTKNMGGALQEFFYSKFPGCQLLEHQSGHFRFQVPKQSLRPYVIFGLLEENKEHLHIDEYGVSETSLEHIFNTMAAQQGDEQLQGSIRYRGA